MSFAVKFNYQPSYAEDTKYSFVKNVFNKGYCPIHNDVLIKKGVIFKKRNECWRCLQKFNQENELFCIKTQVEEQIEEQLIEEQLIEEQLRLKEKELERIQREKEEQLIEELEKKYKNELTNLSDQQIQEQQIQEKNTNEFNKILNILFRFHYEIAGDTGPLYKSFRCRLCNQESITREEFKVVRLGHQNNAGPKHIKNIMPVCLSCHSNWSIKKTFKKRLLHKLCKDIDGREKYVYNHNLVNLDEKTFIHDCDIDKLFPIV
jgi:hypothetical protein